MANKKLKTEQYEFTKSYITYDGLNRMEYVYTAPSDATDGYPCSVTQYAYVGSGSLVEKRKESDSTWDSSWDI